VTTKIQYCNMVPSLEVYDIERTDKVQRRFTKRLRGFSSGS